MRSRPGVVLTLVVALAAGCTAVNAPDRDTGPVGPTDGGPVRPAPPVDAHTTTGPFPTELFHDASLEPLRAEESAALQAVLDRAAADEGVTGGVTAAVVDPSAGMWAGAAGSADGVRPLSPQDQFPIGRLTEAVVAAAVMRLAEEGRIELDAPISDYLEDDFGMNTRGATVRQLMGMTSGYPDVLHVTGILNRLNADPGRAWTPAEALEHVWPAHRPGGPEAYSSTNYLLIGVLLEDVTGMSLAQVLRADVLAGPGLERMVVQPDESPSPPVAAPFKIRPDPLEDAPDPLVELAEGGGYLPSLAWVTAMGGAGAMASDAPSLARWWTALCGGRIVSRTALVPMMRFDDEQGGGYGLGLSDLSELFESPAVGGAEGVGAGYWSVAVCLPEQAAVVVVMTNQIETVHPVGVASELAAVVDAGYWDGPDPYSPR